MNSLQHDLHAQSRKRALPHRVVIAMPGSIDVLPDEADMLLAHLGGDLIDALAQLVGKEPKS